VGTRLTRLARAGRITEKPPFWGCVAIALAVRGGVRARQAALRGSVGYVVAAFVAKHQCQAVRLPTSTSRCWQGPPNRSAHIVLSVGSHRVGPRLYLRRGSGVAPAGNSAHGCHSRSPLVPDSEQEASRERRVRRGCDRAGRGIRHVEVVANGQAFHRRHRQAPLMVIAVDPVVAGRYHNAVGGAAFLR